MTVAGTWENEYGSRMTLVVEGGAVAGMYDSTTGATGRYHVTGWQSATEPTPEVGQPVALTIGWHSVSDGPPDAGMHWTSILGGQIIIVDGGELLSVSHLLVATSGFTGLCERGIYNDKLTYRRVTGSSSLPGGQTPDRAECGDPLAGAWRGDDGVELDVQVLHDASGRVGFLAGALTLTSRKLDITGFTDINAERDNVGFQSVAIAAVDNGRNVTVALGGWIDDATDTLTLQALTNHATSDDSTWLQTTIRPLQFHRCSKA